MIMFKRRTPEAILITVPFTGTHFMKALLEVTDANKNMWSTTYVPHAHWLDASIEENWDKIIQTKLIITARDPYLSAIRNIKPPQENPIEFIADAWNVCFKAMKESNYFIFDIGCQEENRLNHALDVIRFIGIDEIQYEQHINLYIEKWEALSVTDSEYKTKYLETGELPEGYDWGLLDTVVDWYKRLTTHA